MRELFYYRFRFGCNKKLFFLNEKNWKLYVLVQMPISNWRHDSSIRAGRIYMYICTSWSSLLCTSLNYFMHETLWYRTSRLWKTSLCISVRGTGWSIGGIIRRWLVLKLSGRILISSCLSITWIPRSAKSMAVIHRRVLRHETKQASEQLVLWKDVKKHIEWRYFLNGLLNGLCSRTERTPDTFFCILSE